jgi:hypothetical protein
MKELLPILLNFAPDAEIHEILPLGSGHIHSTYLAKTKTKPDIVLQQINTRVFRDPDAVMNNIKLVTQHIRNKLSAKRIQNIAERVLTPLILPDGNLLFSGPDKKVWRCFWFITGRTYDQALNREQVYEGGRAYGNFLNILSDLHPEPMKETIRGFHNMALRLRQFDDARKNGMEERIKEASEEIEKLHTRRDEMMIIQNLGSECSIPVRIVHHDTKINNVLFDETGKGLCVIDLDTVMPGYVHDDFGDSIRTFTNTGMEDEADLSKVSINMDYFKAYADGYLSETRSILSSVEKNYLALSARAMTYMQCLRFLTDHLNGDIYYHISNEGHNLLRTRAQLKLLQSMEDHFDEMQTIIKNLG